MNTHNDSTICAVSSPAGTGAVAIVRMSGLNSIKILSTVIENKNLIKNIEASKIYHSKINDNSGEIIDDVLFCVFKSPKSYTGEDIVEIFCHASEYIQKTIISLLCENGAEIAAPGEFTKRAFLNGKMDLTQSEAVADIIASHSKESLRLAMNQIRGGVSSEISRLRARLVDLLMLLELELDFSEEDVEFADRQQMLGIITDLTSNISGLINSFKYGNAIKSGVPVVIAGQPNVGKSSLLNVLLNDERAIVSEIPGTTRDFIEDEITVNDIRFRFIDTAGIREAGDEIESIGIDRTFGKIEKALIIILVIEAGEELTNIEGILSKLTQFINSEEQFVIIAANKSDKQKDIKIPKLINNFPVIAISALEKTNIDGLKTMLSNTVKSLKVNNQDVIISLARHENALKKCMSALNMAEESLKNNISADFVAQDVREAVYYLGEISGEISNEEVLGAVFEKFCIGK
jgi:tRNA modification GTPase